MSMARNLSDQDTSGAERRSAANTVVSLDARRGKPEWERDVVASLVRFAQLSDDWDSYGGKPLRSDTGMFALQVLSGVMGQSIPTPSIVPVGTGGVQFEWHQNYLDIELYIAAPNDCELTVVDHANGGHVEVTNIKTDLNPIIISVSKLIDYNRHLSTRANAS